MFDKLQDLIPEELPKGISRMQDIQYGVNLVPGAAPPNLATYRNES